MTHGAVCYKGVRTSEVASRTAAASAPTVSRSAPAVAPSVTAAGFAPSRIPVSSTFPSSALAARRPLRRPSQVPVGSVGKDGADRSRSSSPVLEVVGRGGGQPLDPAVRVDMEARLGSDFSDVRVHTGDKAARSAASVSATAYTMGSEVVFSQGSFDPASSAGMRRLAHELVHVQQQRQGPVPGTDSGGGVAISDPADSFEREAEATAARVASGPPLKAPNDLRGHRPSKPSVQLTGGRSVQRCGGVPCDCTADEQGSVQGGSAGPPALQPVQRATLDALSLIEHKKRRVPRLFRQQDNNAGAQGLSNQDVANDDEQNGEYSMPDIEWMPQVSAGNGSGAAASQSSVMVSGGLPAASSASPEITLETGNNASSPVNNAIHQQICVVMGPGMGKDCYSFAATGVQAPEFSSSWLGWSSTVVGATLQGTVYKPDPVAGASVDSRLTPTAAQATKWNSYMLTRLALQDGYSVARHNCRMFSQWELRDAPSHW